MDCVMPVMHGCGPRTFVEKTFADGPPTVADTGFQRGGFHMTRSHTKCTRNI